MYIEHRRITIVHVNKPHEKDLNKELQWIGSSLGLFNARDKDKSCFRIFLELLKAAKKGVSLSSDEIAARSGLTRGTVVHHLDKLMAAGIVSHEKSKYILRVSSLSELIEEIERDAEKAFDNIMNIARDIDRFL